MILRQEKFQDAWQECRKKKGLINKITMTKTRVRRIHPRPSKYNVDLLKASLSFYKDQDLSNTYINNDGFDRRQYSI